MKNIIFDCERMKYENTGLYHYCVNLGLHLQQNLENNSENLCYYTPYNSSYFWQKNRKIYQNSFHKFILPNTNEYQIWHSTYQSSSYIPQLNRKIKVVLTIHDLNFLHEDKCEHKKRKHLQQVQHNINRADAIICISDFCKSDVLNHCDIGNKPIYRIHNGTNNLESPALHARSYKPNRPFLFSIGAICKKKNFHVLLPLLRLHKHLELIIAGGTSDRSYVNYLLQAARQLSVEENVRIVGNISEHEKSWYYQNCYAFAFPSIAEGFGFPVAEAMSVGKPVFLSTRTSLPEIGRSEAFYFSDFSEQHMNDVFIQGMKQYQQTNMQPAIIERGQSFCWDKAAKQYVNIYRSLY